MTPQELTAALRRQRITATREDALQIALSEALTAFGVAFEREARLGPGERIDFLIGAIGIEAKVRCPRRSIYRQLERYAAHDSIEALILVTGTAMGISPAINNKPVYIVSLGRSAL